MKNEVNKKKRFNFIKNGELKISRKQFFRNLSILALIPLGGVWFSTSERKILTEKLNQKKLIPANISNGITFLDTVIVVKNENELKIFSSKCTHLGCRIEKEENGILVCPCHGSKYSSNGKVLKGPANHSLAELPYKRNLKKGEITVEVQV